MADKNTIKNWFKTDLIPTQAQFWSLLDSYFHKDEKIPITAIEDIENMLIEKADTEALTNHVGDAVAHSALFEAKEDKDQKGIAGGYVPLNEFIKIASQYLSIVDNLVTGGSTSLLSAEQGKLLQTQLTAINMLLTSNDVNLDTVQEIVTAIKAVQTSFSNILVNDLTTGGTTKALTAEMGKSLKALYDSAILTKQNIFTADLILAANRNHDLGTKKLKFINGEVEFPALTLTPTAANTKINKVWSDGLKAYLTNNLGINKSLAFDEFTTQIITSGGNYNNLEITADFIIFTNENAQAIINGVWGKPRFKFINLSTAYELKINDKSPSISGTGKQINLPTSSGSVGVRGSAEIIQIDANNYYVSDVWGSKYRPEFKGLTKKHISTIDEFSNAGIMETNEFIVYLDSQSTPLSKEQLNVLFPFATRPFQVVCTLLNLIYMKNGNDPMKWHTLSLTEAT
jgi:hypothetical protein